MNFTELEEDVWIHYNNDHYFVFEITDYDCAAVNAEHHIICLDINDFPIKAEKVKTPIYQLHTKVLYTGPYNDFKQRIGNINYVNENNHHKPYNIMFSNDENDGLWSTPFDFVPIDY